MVVTSMVSWGAEPSSVLDSLMESLVVMTSRLRMSLRRSSLSLSAYSSFEPWCSFVSWAE